MATISFSDAKNMVINAEDWMKKVSDFIQEPSSSPAPADIFTTQKLAFEIDLDELKAVTDSSEKLLGLLGFESDGSLTVVLVGTDKEFAPSSSVLPIETFPVKANMSQLSTVLNVYLKP